MKRFRFGSRPQFFGSSPVQVRIYEQYVPVPVYPGPLGGMDPYRGAGGARVHRGEGRGAVVYDPERERAWAAGVSEEREALRGVAHPPVARALEENAVGETSTWTDPRSGARSAVTPTRDLGGEERCREFRHSVAEPSGELHSVGVACRTPDGIWELLL
ncbi:MAG: RT0821/Lpp0805 family surface protein [Thermodesulfobacteriota bacterium]